MYIRITRGLRRTARWLLIGTAGFGGALLAADSASAATVASFNNGVLTVFGDSLNNTITVSRDAAGTILVNNGAIRVLGGTPTVANTALIQVFGQSGNDVLSLVETNGSLPRANLFGGTGNDQLTGGSGGDQLFGQSGNDNLQGRGGFDFLFGGGDNDNLTGGDADDQAFGESGNDTMVWNPGDDTDLNEGGTGNDTVEVNGGNGTEAFTTTANGTRVRFDRLNPAPFSIDIGASETLVLNANGGDDSFSATGNLASLIAVNVDGGEGADILLGTNGVDRLFGGAGNDFLDGQQGNDVAFMGAGADTFQWDPGDGSDSIEGDADTDTMLFNGSGGNERFVASANGERLRFTRDLGNIVMDTNDVEVVDLNALGGTDTTTVNDLSGTDVVEVNADLAGLIGGTAGDAAADTVVVNGTNGVDIIDLFGSVDAVSVLGLTADVNITRSEGANDALVVSALGADDGLTATTMPAGIIKTTLDGGVGSDRILGSQGSDTLVGDEGSDFVFGDNGNDLGRLGAGDDTFQWDPGDGNDTVEGEAGADSMAFFGANIAEAVDVTANGTRVRFARDIANVIMDLNGLESIDFRALGGADSVDVGDLSGTGLTAFSADLRGSDGAGDGAADTLTVSGTTGADTISVGGDSGGVTVTGLPTTVSAFFQEAANDRLVINAQGGDDVVDATSLEADGIQLTENGGLGVDNLTGSGGDDLVNGGDGNDVAFLGAGDDSFVWNPGDDNDTLEGEDGVDTMDFNGANVAEDVTVSANGGRATFFRNVAAVTMDLNDVEDVDFDALGGADIITVNDLSGTDVANVNLNLAGSGGGGDGQPDNVTARATNGDDIAVVVGGGGSSSVIALSAQVNVNGSEGANDHLTVDALAGEDIIEATGLQAGTIQLVEKGGDGGDILVGSPGNDVLLGEAGDDVLVGGGGTDVLDGGDGDDIEIQSVVAAPGTALLAASGDRVISATTADAAWIVEHVQIVNGQTVITIDGRSYTVGTDLSQVLAQASEILAQLAPVGDFVWEDRDGDGVQDADEPGIAGVAVRLLDADGQVVAKAVTDGAGRYELVPTEPGEFTVEVVIPDGFVPTLGNAGGDDAADSDADPAKVVVGEDGTTVRVTVGDAAEGTLDVGLVAEPVEPTTTTTTAPPTTTLPPTTVPPTTAVPTTTVPPTTALPTVPPTTAPVPTTEAPATTVPETTVPAEVPTTAPAPTTAAPEASAPAG